MNIRDRRSGVFEVLSLLVVWVLAALPFLRPGSNVYGFDTLSYTGPNLETTFRSWRSFDIPMWNDGIFGGVPFLGRLNSQGLYPIHLPFAFMDTSDALDLLGALHLLILAIGMFLFVRIGWRLKSPAGFVAGTLVLSAAYTSVKMLSYEQLVAIAWIPWILLLIELVLRRPDRLISAGPLSLVLSFFLLGSHPQTVFIAALGLAGYLAVRLFDTRTLRSLRTMTVAAVLSVTTCVLQLVAAFFLGSSSATTGKRSLAVLDQPAYVLQTSNLLLALLGDPFSKNPTGVSGSGETVLGIGAIAVGLAVVGLIMGRRASLVTRIGLATGVLASILLAMGPNQILFRILYRVVPGFGLARVAGRWLLITLVFLILLAALGVDAICRRESKKWDTTLVAVTLAGLSAFVFFHNQARLSGDLRYWWLLGLVVPAGGVALASRRFGTSFLLIPLAAIVLAGAVSPLLNSPATKQVFSRGIDEVPSPLLTNVIDQPGRIYAQTFDRFDNYPYLIATLRPNAQGLFQVRTIDGYDGGQWIQDRWVTSMRSLARKSFNTDLTLRSQVRGPLDAAQFARFGVRWVLVDTEVVPSKDQLSGWTGPLEREGTVELWSNPEWRGEGLLYFGSEIRQPKVARQLQLAIPDNAIVEDPAMQLSCDFSSAKCTRKPARKLHSDGDSGEFEIDISRPAVLAIDQAWSKDWVVKVDGRPAKTGPVNVNQLGVRLEAGRHTVEYKYSPSWYFPALLLGWLGAIVATVLLAVWLLDLTRELKAKRNPQDLFTD